jgi:hypothetical protein
VRVWLVLAILAACGGGSSTPKITDGPTGSDAPPDTPPDSYGACVKFNVTPQTAPAHITGAVAGATLQAPAHCAQIDAPYGVVSAGPDSVFEIGGLVVGTKYVVQLTASADLSFYVATGCTSASGPSDADCLLFEDASPTGNEVGQFTATGTTAYIVIDTFTSTPPANASFTLDVFADSCTSASDCSAGVPACVNGRCVQCATSFDCTDAAAPRCDAANTCQTGVDTCLTDDPAEPHDDGPAGATVLVPDGTGYAAHSAQICSNPATEADFYAFDVASVGDTWDFALSWQGAPILHLDLYDAAGLPLGASYWEEPQTARLTFLAPGRYYAVVTEVAPANDAAAVNYTLEAQRTAGTGCTGSADCAATYRNQIYRGDCVAGSCVHLPATGAVAELGACDRQADCASGLSCPSFFFVSSADTRDVCARSCSGDTDCAVLGAGYVCTTYLAQNFCVQKCTSSSQCPTSTTAQPGVGPWYRLTCDAPSGRCLP